MSFMPTVGRSWYAHVARRLFLVGMLATNSAATCRAQTVAGTAEDARQTARKFVNDRVQLQRDRGLQEWLSKETARLNFQREQGLAATSLMAEMKSGSPYVSRQILDLLEEAVRAANAANQSAGLDLPALKTNAAEAASLLPEDIPTIDQDRERWITNHSHLIGHRELMTEAVERLRSDFQSHGSTCETIVRWTLPSLALLLFWMAIGCARLPWLRRNSARGRRWWPLAALGTGCAVSLALLGVLDYRLFRVPTGPPLPAIPATPTAPLASDDEIDVERNRAARRMVESQKNYGDAWTAWHDAVVQVLPASAKLLDAWREMRGSIRDASVSNSIHALIESQLVAEQAESKSIDATLPLLVPDLTWTWGVLALVGAHWTVFLVGVMVRFRAKLWTKTFARCPRCSTRGQLKVEVINRVPEYVCNAPWFDGKPCAFRLPPQHLAVRELYFPTVGTPGAGKTLWLMGLYTALVKMCEFDTKQLDFEPFPTEATRLIEDLLRKIEMPPEELRQLIIADRNLDEAERERAIAMAREGGLEVVDATTRAPHPLVVRYNRKNLPATNVFLHIFDYAGEITKQDRKHPLRQRMLNANGLLLFLDPNRPASELDGQIESINLLNQHADREAANMPVAVCVTKLDMVESQFPGDVDDGFKKQYFGLEGEANPNSMIWEHLEKRSEATFDYLTKKWPKTLVNNLDRLGTHYMFFPLSAAGHMRPKGPGPLRPENVLQPLFWLLTMNGYPALAREREAARRKRKT